MDKRELRSIVERVVSFAAGRVPFEVELRSFTVEHGFMDAVFVVDGRELALDTTGLNEVSVARMLAVEAEWRARDIQREFSVSNLWSQWWRVEAGDDMGDLGDDAFSVEAIEMKLQAVYGHVMAAVESDSEHYKNLLKLAEVLRAYPDRVKPTEFGQIMQGMVETAVASEYVFKWFVETEDFVGEGAWHPEAWSEFLEDLDALRSRFGADLVDNLIVPVPGFDPTDEATWPDDGIAATFYEDFLKLFDVSDMEA